MSLRSVTFETHPASFVMDFISSALFHVLAEETSYAVHACAVERVGEKFCEDPLPRHFHERGAGFKNRAYRVPGTGMLAAFNLHYMYQLIHSRP